MRRNKEVKETTRRLIKAGIAVGILGGGSAVHMDAYAMENENGTDITTGSVVDKKAVVPANENGEEAAKKLQKTLDNDQEGTDAETKSLEAADTAKADPEPVFSAEDSYDVASTKLDEEMEKLGVVAEEGEITVEKAEAKIDELNETIETKNGELTEITGQIETDQDKLSGDLTEKSELEQKASELNGTISEANKEKKAAEDLAKEAKSDKEKIGKDAEAEKKKINEDANAAKKKINEDADAAKKKVHEDADALKKEAEETKKAADAAAEKTANEAKSAAEAKANKEIEDLNKDTKAKKDAIDAEVTKQEEEATKTANDTKDGIDEQVKADKEAVDNGTYNDELKGLKEAYDTANSTLKGLEDAKASTEQTAQEKASAAEQAQQTLEQKQQEYAGYQEIEDLKGEIDKALASKEKRNLDINTAVAQDLIKYYIYSQNKEVDPDDLEISGLNEDLGDVLSLRLPDWKRNYIQVTNTKTKEVSYYNFTTLDKNGNYITKKSKYKNTVDIGIVEKSSAKSADLSNVVFKQSYYNDVTKDDYAADTKAAKAAYDQAVSDKDKADEAASLAASALETWKTNNQEAVKAAGEAKTAYENKQTELKKSIDADATAKKTKIDTDLATANKARKDQAEKDKKAVDNTAEETLKGINNEKESAVKAANKTLENAKNENNNTANTTKSRIENDTNAKIKQIEDDANAAKSKIEADAKTAKDQIKNDADAAKKKIDEEGKGKQAAEAKEAAKSKAKTAKEELGKVNARLEVLNTEIASLEKKLGVDENGEVVEGSNGLIEQKAALENEIAELTAQRDGIESLLTEWNAYADQYARNHANDGLAQEDDDNASEDEADAATEEAGSVLGANRELNDNEEEAVAVASEESGSVLGAERGRGKSPKTGDTANVLGAVATMGSSLAGVGAIVGLRRRSK